MRAGSRPFDHSTIYRWVQHFAPEMESACAGSGAGHGRLNTDKAPTYAAAIAEFKAEGKCPDETRHRQVKGSVANLSKS